MWLEGLTVLHTTAEIHPHLAGGDVKPCLSKYRYDILYIECVKL